MSTPKYFREFPDLQYALSHNKAGQPSHIKIKDYFNLLTVRDDIFREETLYAPYEVKNGQRPDQISHEVYGDEQFYWIILQVNNISNYYEEWPLSETELTAFVYKKYGGEVGAGSVHHWETVATYDEATPPNLVLPGELKVPADFKFTYPTTPGSNVLLSSFPVSISNYTYERVLNEKKGQIYILDKKYIYNYERETRNYARRIAPSVSYVDISEHYSGHRPEYS